MEASWPSRGPVDRVGVPGRDIEVCADIEGAIIVDEGPGAILLEGTGVPCREMDLEAEMEAEMEAEDEALRMGFGSGGARDHPNIDVSMAVSDRVWGGDWVSVWSTSIALASSC